MNRLLGRGVLVRGAVILALLLVALFALPAVVSAGLVVLYGKVGMISLGQFALLAVGTWTGLRLNYLVDLPFPLLLLATGAVTCVVGVVIGLPALRLSGFEAAIGSHYSFKTVSFLRRRCPGVHFVWIMGADNLRSFHRWQKWRDIAGLVPITVIDRLGPSLYATGGIAAQALRRWRIPESAAKSLPLRKPPAWTYLHGLKSPLSSTALRRKIHGKA